MSTGSDVNKAREKGDNNNSNKNDSIVSKDGMNVEENRLKTFNNWTNIVMPAERLARAGFYWPNECIEKVKCFKCGFELSEWKFGMTAMGAHRRINPNCEFILGTDTDNVSLPMSLNLSSYSSLETTNNASSLLVNYSPNTSLQNSEQIKIDDKTKSLDEPFSYGDSLVETLDLSKFLFPVYASLRNRLKSYESINWPSETVFQTPNQLAEAGFFYIGEYDRVQCFCCGGIVHDWVEGDDPVVDHAKYFPNCPYIKQLKGSNFVEDVKENYPKHAVESTILSKMEKEKKTSRPGSSSDEIKDSKDSLKPLISQNSVIESGVEKLQLNSLSDVKDESLCIICLERLKCVALIPCGHVNCCVECSTSLSKSTCPTCRSQIKSTFRVYL